MSDLQVVLLLIAVVAVLTGYLELCDRLRQ